MDCSSLNHHLFSKNIIDSPLCICGRPETTKHYLFDCNRFNNLRQEMMQSISQLCEPTLNALLYRVTGLSDETNRQLFIIIQEYCIYSGLNDSNKLPLSNYFLTLRFTNYYTFIICINVRKMKCSIPVEPLSILLIIENFPNSRSTFEYQN